MAKKLSKDVLLKAMAVLFMLSVCLPYFLVVIAVYWANR